MPHRTSTSTDPFDFIIFGAIGNLSENKLIPALYHRYQAHEFSQPFRIIGLSRNPASDETFRAFAEKTIKAHANEANLIPKELDFFLKTLSHLYLDANTGEGFEELEKLIGKSEKNRIFYLAVAPDFFGKISQKLMEHKMITPQSRIVVEKPVGCDLLSAKAVNDVIGSCFNERQIFRIDHYLGKETVQNLMALRFANVLYEPQWNAAHIDNVQITVAETVGLEYRLSYYDTAGALRDMAQNHLLQLLCLVAMEAPSSMDADSVRDEKLKVLRSLKPIGTPQIASKTVRGQYQSGISEGVSVKGYVEELGTQSDTETFVALKAEIENWRWGGVPFYLRTGKRLASRVSEIVIQFKKIPHSIFMEQACDIPANQLVVRLQPNEGIKQFIMIKNPGSGDMRLREIPLDMSFAKSFRERAPDAYERLLVDVARGNQTLFMRRDEVEAAWGWIDPILKAWKSENQHVSIYNSGSQGPEEANLLLARDGHCWREIN